MGPACRSSPETGDSSQRTHALLPLRVPFVSAWRSFVTFRLAVLSWRRNIAAMLAHSILALSLVIRIHDQYGVPHDHLAKARATAEAIMNAAGVAVTWPDCPCLSRVGSDELVIRIARAFPSAEPGSLGFSVLDIGQQAGTLATVFADRVQDLAALAEVDAGELMGRVIAHEIAHLLAGARGHAPGGLLRAKWTVSELIRQRPADWLLSRPDVVRIRQAVRQRSRASLPALTIVDADPTPDVSAQ
jgi:hypothetical protein